MYVYVYIYAVFMYDLMNREHSIRPGIEAKGWPTFLEPILYGYGFLNQGAEGDSNQSIQRSHAALSGTTSRLPVRTATRLPT